jgi:hypothetical protein
MTQRPFGDRLLELFAAGILGVATVATAWCAYQAAAWNDNETQEARDAGGHRIEAARLFNLGTQKVAYDATIAALYAQAIAQNQPELQQFYRDNLVRPEFLPVIQEWEEQAANDEDLTNLLENEEYLQEQAGPSAAEDAAAEEALRRGEDASDNAAGFVQTTIFLASALFFAGITSNFRSRVVRLLLLFGSTTVLAIGIARIADLPVA